MKKDEHLRRVVGDAVEKTAYAFPLDPIQILAIVAGVAGFFGLGWFFYSKTGAGNDINPNRPSHKGGKIIRW
jgi:hypothetical protein